MAMDVNAKYILEFVPTISKRAFKAFENMLKKAADVFEKAMNSKIVKLSKHVIKIGTAATVATTGALFAGMNYASNKIKGLIPHADKAMGTAETAGILAESTGGDKGRILRTMFNFKAAGVESDESFNKIVENFMAAVHAKKIGTTANWAGFESFISHLQKMTDKGAAMQLAKSVLGNREAMKIQEIITGGAASFVGVNRQVLGTRSDTYLSQLSGNLEDLESKVAIAKAKKEFELFEQFGLKSGSTPSELLESLLLEQAETNESIKATLKYLTPWRDAKGNLVEGLLEQAKAFNEIKATLEETLIQLITSLTPLIQSALIPAVNLLDDVVRNHLVPWLRDKFLPWFQNDFLKFWNEKVVHFFEKTVLPTIRLAFVWLKNVFYPWFKDKLIPWVDKTLLPFAAELLEFLADPIAYGKKLLKGDKKILQDWGMGDRVTGDKVTGELDGDWW